MISVSWSQVRARRLERSGLGTRFDDAIGAAHATGGIHAQVQGSAELQLAIRVEGIDQAGVRDALWADRSLVKAWTLRGTLHIHPSRELALWHAASRSRDPGGLEEWRDPHGVLHPALPAAQAGKARAAVLRALTPGPLTRDQLAQAVSDPAARDRVRSGFAFLTGELVQGPPQGAKATLARPDRWIAGWCEVDRSASLAEACRRFLHAYGPARPADFREWLAGRWLAAEQARAVFESLNLDEVDVEGRRALVLPGDTAFPPARPSVRLLPEYDVYIMGSRERDQLIPPTVRDQLAAAHGRYAGPAGVRFLLVDGVAAGLWRRAKRGRRLDLTVSPTVRLTKPQRAELGEEAERMAHFLGLDAALIVDGRLGFRA